jgi:hypothetical protein
MGFDMERGERRISELACAANHVFAGENDALRALRQRIAPGTARSTMRSYLSQESEGFQNGGNLAFTFGSGGAGEMLG